MTNGTTRKKVQLFSDGACLGNPGPGGYGVILRHGTAEKELSAGFQLTTNNRMELMGVIVGLEALKEPCDVHAFTDSEYVVNSLKLGWAKKWRANGWIKSDRKPAINSDLWGRLLDLCDTHNVKIEWVRGHAGHPENERCDFLAVQAAKSESRIPDTGYKPAAAVER